MNPVIVNVSVGARFEVAQERQRESLDKVGYKGAYLAWVGGYPMGSPTHDAVPYAFKVYAIEEAIRRGHDVILWADASVQFLKSPMPILEEIARDGYWISTQGWWVGQWCTDEALPKLGVTREQAFKIPMVAATFFGVNAAKGKMQELLTWWGNCARNGAFKGPHKIDDGKDEGPTKVLGHRHDQTCLSVIVHHQKLKVYYPPCRFSYPHQTDANTIAEATGA